VGDEGRVRSLEGGGDSLVDGEEDAGAGGIEEGAEQAPGEERRGQEIGLGRGD